MTDQRASQSGRMPVLFVGHGSPMNVIEDNRWSRGFAALGDRVPRPAAILAMAILFFIVARPVRFRQAMPGEGEGA